MQERERDQESFARGFGNGVSYRWCLASIRVIEDEKRLDGVAESA
jgi:hypothetical protein